MVQLSSQSCGRDNNEALFKPGMILVCRALLESVVDDGNRPDLVAVRVVASGSVTVGPLLG